MNLTGLDLFRIAIVYVQVHFEYGLIFHTQRRYELQPVKDMTQESDMNKKMIRNLKRIKSTCII